MNPAVAALIIDVAALGLWLAATVGGQATLLVFLPLVTAFAVVITVVFAGLHNALAAVILFFVLLMVLEIVAVYGIAGIHGVY